MKHIKKWTIRGTLVATLLAGGYFVGDWDDEKGYPVIAPETDSMVVKDLNGDSSHTVYIDKSDTTWFSDSTELEDFARVGAGAIGGRLLVK